MTSLEAWSLEYLMTLALEGKPIFTLADRMEAYEAADIDMSGCTQDEIYTADQEAHAIQLTKRIAA
jgi:hypothetical protein